MNVVNTTLSPTAEVLRQIADRNREAAVLQFSAPQRALQLAHSALTLSLQTLGMAGDAESTGDLIDQLVLEAFDNTPQLFPYLIEIGESLAILTRCYIESADYTRAIISGQKAKTLSQRHPDSSLLPRVLNLLGYANLRIGQYVESLHCYIDTFHVSQRLGDREHEARALVGQASVYAFSGNQTKAITAYRAGYNLFEEIGDRSGQRLAIVNLGDAYEVAGEYEQALICGLHGLKLSEELGLHDLGYRLVHQNIGAAYLGLRNFPAAESYITKALTLAKAHGDPYIVMLATLELGRLHRIQGAYPVARMHLEIALADARAQGQKMFQYEAHKELADLYEASGAPVEALAHFQQFHAVHQDVLNLQNKIQLSAMELEQEFAIVRQEAALAKHLAEQLEQEVAKRTMDLQSSLTRETLLTEQLNKALRKEVELQQFKTQIIATASHEFRTPLSIISFATDILTTRYEQLTPAKRVHHQTRIREQILYLTDLLDDICTINNVLDEPPNYQAFQFGDFCCQLQQEVAQDMHEWEKVHFRCAEQGQTITTDILLMQRILKNLLSNAAKFSPIGVPIEVAIECADNSLTLTVTDQGIGIPLNEQKQIFDIFYRGSNLDEQRGLGIGLSIVQQAVEALRGHITVSSAGPGLGSTFTVHIPVLQQSTAQRARLG